MSIYVAHNRNISNALDTLIMVEEKNVGTDSVQLESQSWSGSIVIVSRAKTAEPIQMHWTRVGSGNRVLDGVQIPRGGAISRGNDGPL